ncbi:MAG: bifunctional diaminohydroxyphosphoribosylaminopyrimidine deaminase/5-amino-6-(5-phosphoribosylamino)uracil reductase RibD [Verrucomicrobia bacterium]|nr:bifunctional diaminohydroxyphosphoribosylaminopyrimidine deaminase/5-amino-6-(5-phosphoribosylamino)uracil reductase RibD [Verrucomicrobiota bacterium]
MRSSVEFDAEMMERALALARRAMGQTSPNPMVGAVVVRNHRIIAEGYHHRAGAPHAEIHALNAAGDRAKGCDLYVTLEPCCTHGRTPPCTDAIIKAGIRRVVVAAVDPNPKHSGQGLELLKKADIRVEVGLLGEAANRLNEPFNKWIRTGMPFLTVKAAMSLDGKIATRTGESKWITGEKSRAFVQELRRAADAVMVGSGTVAADNPRLTVRDGGVDEQPWRVVVDSGGRTALDAHVFSDEDRLRTMVLTSERAPTPWRKQLADQGVTVLPCALRGDHLDVSDVLKQLSQREIINVLVEGGGSLLGALFDARLVDKVVFFYAPKVIGGTNAPTAVEGQGIGRLKDAVELRNIEWRHLGDDLVLIGYC